MGVLQVFSNDAYKRLTSRAVLAFLWLPSVILLDPVLSLACFLSACGQCTSRSVGFLVRRKGILSCKNFGLCPTRIR